METITSKIAIILALSLTFGLPVSASYIIPDGAVKTAKIASGAVTQEKLASRATGTTVAAGGVAVSASSGSYNQSNPTPNTRYDITNLSVTITTTGRPVLLMLVSDGTDGAGAGSIGVFSNNQAPTGVFGFVRGSTDVGFFWIGGPSGAIVSGSLVNFPCSVLSHVDVVAAGTYTYKVVGKYTSGGSSTSLDARNVKLVAFEL